MSNYHIPVMPSEVLNFLNIKTDQWYIDCNLGGGGHTDLILKKGGKVLGIDLDEDAITEVSQRHNLTLLSDNGIKKAVSDNLILYQGNFSQLKQIVNDLNLGHITGILFDLGVSTHQLEEASRGFSFNLDAPLDMRMDKTIPVSAKDLINGLHEKELSELFWKLGEERYAKAIAKKIVEVRKTSPIETTDQLAKIITSVRPRGKTDRTHPATRIFQALRIAVNDELNSLKDALPQTIDILQPKGRLVVISFHSLEDRIVKNFLSDQAAKGNFELLTKKPVSPEDEEIDSNPRSRSGKLRAAEKV